MAKEPLVWNELDTDSFKGDMAKAYAAYVEARTKAKEAKDAFEVIGRKALVAAKVVETDNVERVVFGYNFGKCSVAIAPEKKAKAKSANLISLS